jgi:1-acyl-sn-glycerol-3-phosphate acyltransferase
MASWTSADSAIKASLAGSTAFEGFCRMFFSSYCSLVVEGSHHVPKGPFLLCSNHSSHADSAALMTASGRSFRSFALLGASDYFFQSRRIRWSVSPWMNVIPIERSARPKALTHCLDACRGFLEQTGGALILYPEGTRSPDGEMRPFKPGVGFFVSELRVPVLPAYIDGTRFILPKGRFVPRPGSVTVRFGEALALAAPPHNRGDALRDWRRNVVEQLSQSIRTLSLGEHVQELVARAGQSG